ncbi:hypothetical protein ECML606-1_000095 [Escherichia phage ECML-606-1]|nr:hypothetical protein ECML606-1_000095 [Escherichia phage ECML-606-1]
MKNTAAEELLKPREKSEHLLNAERIAEEAEALAARCTAADKPEPFTWGLMFVDTGKVYYSESCVGSEEDMRNEAMAHNVCCEEAVELHSRICAVPLWLREGGTNAKTAELWECHGCGHLYTDQITSCDCCEPGHKEFTKYQAVLYRA